MQKSQFKIIMNIDINQMQKSQSKVILDIDINLDSLLLILFLFLESFLKLVNKSTAFVLRLL